MQNNLINNFLTQSTFVLMREKLYLLFEKRVQISDHEINDLFADVS